MGSEKYANRCFWMDDRLPDGLEQGENERKACFGGLRDEVSGRMST